MRRLLYALALAAGLTLASTGIAAAHGNTVVGHVYVNDNTAPENTVAGFDRHADGSLTPIPGSPFAAGGAGTGASIGSQGALQVSVSGHYLLAVDPGSNQISVLKIRHDGSLTSRATVSSGGAEPVSLAVHRHLVYVANGGAGASNYTGFRFRGGHLRPLPGSTVPLPDSASPGDVLFNSTGTFLIGTRVGTSQIDSFTVGGQGRLHAAPGSPFAAQGPGPFGSEFRPTDPSELYVSNAHGGAGAGTVSAFRLGANGKLLSIGASPFPDQQTAPCWVEISHDGRYLFTVNTGSSSISSYAIGTQGALHLIGSTPFREASSTLSAFDARLSPDGTTLWVVESGAPAVTGFAVSGGHLTELATAPTALPAGAKPFGIVVN